MQTANLTATATLHIVLNELSSFNLVLKQWQDAAKTIPVDWPTGVWKMSVFSGNGEALLRITNNSGITAVANVMTIRRNNIQNKLAPGKYNYNIRCDFPDGTNIYPFEGILTIIKKMQ